MSIQQWPKWRLKAKESKRFKDGHPWVYSNELQSSPKGIEPGAWVTLCDAGGEFLAYGHGNPHSLIAFRAISRTDNQGLQEEDLLTEGLVRRLTWAYQRRKQLGLVGESFRWVFGEADQLSGLVIDVYRIDDRISSAKTLLVIQAHSAGQDQWLKQHLDLVITTFEKCDACSSASVGVILRNDVRSRKLEGLEIEAPKVYRELASTDFSRLPVRIRSGAVLTADFISGQKTGLFLDQVDNTLALRDLLKRQSVKELRVLDLFSYVGQWGAALKQEFSKAHVTAVDVSEQALEFNSADEKIKADLFVELEKTPSRSYDVVICDPPALIQSRKDLPQGKHAYLKLNSLALKRVKPGGLYVSCSCSGLLSEEDFRLILAKSERRAFEAQELQWILRSGQALDHPTLASFPEGRYLKTWFAQRKN